MKIYLKIKPSKGSAAKEDGVIKDVKFETLGCAAAIATSSVLTEKVKGKALKKALRITKDDIVKALGGLPAPKVHCSLLGIDALKKAADDYLKK